MLKFSYLFVLLYLLLSTLLHAQDSAVSQDPASIIEEKSAFEESESEEPNSEDRLEKNEETSEKNSERSNEQLQLEKKRQKRESESYYEAPEQKNSEDLSEDLKDARIDTSKSNNTFAATTQVIAGIGMTYLIALPITIVRVIVSFIPLIGIIANFALIALQSYITASAVTATGNALSDRQGHSLPSFIADFVSIIVLGTLATVLSLLITIPIALYSELGILSKIEDGLQSTGFPSVFGPFTSFYAIILLAAAIYIPLQFVALAISQSISTYVYYQYASPKKLDDQGSWHWPNFTDSSDGQKKLTRKKRERQYEEREDEPQQDEFSDILFRIIQTRRIY